MLWPRVATWSRLIAALLLAIALSGCDRGTPESTLPHPKLSETSARIDACLVDAPTARFRTALCSGDVVDMIFAIDEVLKLEDQNANDSMIGLLERVWRRDQTLGKELPWERLGNDKMRLILAEQLAQPIRWGRSGVSLEELRELALRQADGGQGDRTDAIRLLGLADVRGQATFLMRIVESSPSASERYAAIQALGMTCDTESNAVLEALRSIPSLNSAESNAVQESLRRRATWVRDLCARAVPIP